MAIKTIVLGYDGSDSARAALDRAGELSQALGARTVVVSVEPLVIPADAAAAGPFMFAPYAVPVRELVPDASERDRWQRHLEYARDVLAGRGVEVELASPEGRPAEELVNAADEHDADLIVVGTHDPGFLERLFAGSVGQDVARHAHCDVLIVRGEQPRSGNPLL
jgi:nucleotide-binding universal stress UspA family protein